MSLQSTNGNQNIVMIPTNDDNVDTEPSSSSALRSEPIKSSQVLILSKNISLQEDNEIETKMETDLNNVNTKVVEVSKSNVTAVKTNKKLNNRSLNCSKLRINKMPRRQWKIAHGRLLTNQNKNENGDERTCQKNVEMQHKSFETLATSNTHVDITNIDVNEQKSEHILAELCASSTDCIACKETFLDKLELHKHTTIAHPDVTIKFCDLCDYTFFNDEELQNHILTIHEQSTEINEQQNDIQELIILNEFENMGECSEENIPKNSEEKNQLMNNSKCQTIVDVDKEQTSTEPLVLIDVKTINPIGEFPYAVKVEIAQRENDIFSYTALEEKKEYTLKEYKNCEEMNETSVVECEWTNPKQSNSNESTQDSDSINNEVQLENCLTSSMEEFQDIEELEPSCEVDHTEKDSKEIEKIIENSDFEYKNRDKTQSASDTSAIESTKSIDELSAEQSIQSLDNDSNAILLPSKSPSSAICRTYSSKMNSQVLKKPPTIIKYLIEEEEEINFCIMCREIFSLIEQKSVKTIPDSELIFKCPLCSQQFESRALLEKHVAYHHLNCECTKITKSSPSSSSSTITLETSIAQDLYECVLCPTTFNDYNKLNNHILTLHEPMPPFKDRLTIGKPEYLRTIRCSYMDSKMSRGKRISNNANSSNLNCFNCSLTFFSFDDYILHVKQLHNNMTPIENISWTPGETSQNLENSISQIPSEINIENQNFKLINESMNNHLLENIGDSIITKNFNELRKTCKRCNKEFESVRELSEHFYFSHDDTLESQAIMAAASNADKRSHDWSCLHCSQRFKQLQSYIRHRYFVHNDESMVHICENCCKILTSVTMVNVHVCLNVSSWECKPCNQIFQNGVELRLHNTETHSETPGPHICTICNKRFLTKTMLIRHQESKNCYPNVRPPENSNIIRKRLNNESSIKKIKITGKRGKLSSSEKKPKRKYQRVHDIPHMHVIQEDVFVRDEKDKNNMENENHNSLSLASHNTEHNDKIYQCSMCKLYFLSKAGLKVHLSRAHTSAVEICQLCYKMFVTGNLVRHMTDNHLKHDNNNQSYYKAMRVKQHNTFHIDEHDIEKDTEDLIATIGTTQLLGLCEYQRFTEQSDDNDRFCPDCPLAFDNSEKYRRHYVQTHDKLCALCNMEFETGQEASRHKTRIHGSMACYVWFAHKLIAAISDTKTFSEMAEKIIIETIPIEKNEVEMEIEESKQDQNYDNEVVMAAAQVEAAMAAEDIDSGATTKRYDGWINTNNNQWVENGIVVENSFKEERDEGEGEVIEVNEEESSVIENIDHVKNEEIDILKNDTPIDDNYINDNTGGDNNNDDGGNEEGLDDYNLFILVTEDDLEKYNNNISELARQIYSTCNIFSIDQIERMLEPYAKM